MSDNQNFENTTTISSDSVIPIENPDIPAAGKDGKDDERLDFGSRYTNPNGKGSNDQYSGTQGKDIYDVNLLLNTTPEIMQEKSDESGKIDWTKVANTNANYHDHWVEGIGQDTINNFSGSGGDGDKINIAGHTAAVKVIEESDNQIQLGLYSDQGGDGYRGTGAHDLDILGKITVNHDGNFDYGRDVSVSSKVFDAVVEYAPNQGYLDSNNQEHSSEEDNEANLGMTSDDSNQSFEDTTIYVSSDSAVPIQNPNIPPAGKDGADWQRLNFHSAYTNPNGQGSNDRYSGTRGANTFEFNPLLNAKPEILQMKRFSDENGKIDWTKVAQANENYHNHWVEGFGQDTITDFSGSGGEGDKIKIVGHTVAVKIINKSDDKVTLGVYSDQGGDGYRGTGAHDLDVLGTITVKHDGNFDYGSDVSVNPNVFDAVTEYV